MKKYFQFRGKENLNVWKIVAVVFIILFCIALIGGLFKIYHFKSSFTTPTQDQIDSAKAIVAQELQNEGDNIDGYEVTVSKNIRRFGRMDSSKNTIQVSLRKNATSHLFIIDIDSGNVLMHSQTDFYGSMADLPMKIPPNFRDCNKGECT